MGLSPFDNATVLAGMLRHEAMRETVRRKIFASVMCIAAAQVSVSTAAFAQGTAPAAPQAGAPAQSSAERIAEARRRYELGLKLYEDGDYEASRIEFERALALAPSYRILYNVGLAYKQLNNYVDALRSFEQYLEQGGSEITPERRADVEREITQLRPRIAKVTIEVNVADAEVAIDDRVIGKAPLNDAVPVNPGVRKFSARAPGYLPTVKTSTVGSSEAPKITLELTKLPEQQEQNPFTLPTVIGWSATGAAAIATTVFGILALDAKSDQEAALDRFGTTDGQRQDARDKTQTLSAVTDVLAVGTMVLGGVSTYFTLRMLSWQPSTPEAPKGTAAKKPRLDLTAGVRGVAFGGTF